MDKMGRVFDYITIVMIVWEMKSKKTSNGQEPTQSDSTSCPQNQKGNN